MVFLLQLAGSYSKVKFNISIENKRLNAEEQAFLQSDNNEIIELKLWFD